MKKYWEKWKCFAKKVGNLQTTIIFSVLYFLIITPLGLIIGIFSDNLNINNLPSWKKFNGNEKDIKELHKQ